MGKLPRSKMTGTSYPVVADLPTGVYEGIGSVVQAHHAILETALQELLFHDESQLSGWSRCPPLPIRY